MRRWLWRTALLLMACGLSGCFGPQPSVVRQTLQPPVSLGQPYTLVVTIANRGRGEGEAEVIARLRSRATGETVAITSQGVDFKAHETVSLAIPLQTAQPGDYEPKVEVNYPPE